MVSEVSAIEVASTTLRRPAGAGAMARSCSSVDELAVERGDVGVGWDSGSRGARRCGRSRPGRGGRRGPSPASSRERGEDAACHLVLEPLQRIGRDVAGLDRKGPALAFDHRRVAEQRRRRGRRRWSPTSPAGADRGAAPWHRAPARGRDRHRGCARGTRRTARRQRRVSSGSSSSMRVKTPSVTTSMRVAGADLATRGGRDSRRSRRPARRAGAP